MSREIAIAEWAEQINSAFKAEQTEYRKLCKLCAEAEELSRDEKEALYKLLAFSPSRFSKYAKIGQNLDVIDANGILTGCYSIDSIVAQLDKFEIMKGLASKVLHPDCTRQAVIDFKKLMRPTSRPVRKHRVAATVSVVTTASSEILRELQKLLSSLRKLDGVKITEPENKVETEEKAYKGNLDKQFRSDAKTVVAILAKEKLAPDKVNAANQQLDSGSNTDIAQVLLSVGADPEVVKARAFEIVAVPPTVLKRHPEEERRKWLTWEPPHSLKSFLEQKADAATSTSKAAAKKMSGR